MQMTNGMDFSQQASAGLTGWQIAGIAGFAVAALLLLLALILAALSGVTE